MALFLLMKGYLMKYNLNNEINTKAFQHVLGRLINSNTRGYSGIYAAAHAKYERNIRKCEACHTVIDSATDIQLDLEKYYNDLHTKSSTIIDNLLDKDKWHPGIKDVKVYPMGTSTSEKPRVKFKYIFKPILSDNMECYFDGITLSVTLDLTVLAEVCGQAYNYNDKILDYINTVELLLDGGEQNLRNVSFAESLNPISTNNFIDDVLSRFYNFNITGIDQYFAKVDVGCEETINILIDNMINLCKTATKEDIYSRHESTEVDFNKLYVLEYNEENYHRIFDIMNDKPYCIIYDPKAEDYEEQVQRWKKIKHDLYYYAQMCFNANLDDLLYHSYHQIGSNNLQEPCLYILSNLHRSISSTKVMNVERFFTDMITTSTTEVNLNNDPAIYIDDLARQLFPTYTGADELKKRCAEFAMTLILTYYLMSGDIINQGFVYESEEVSKNVFFEWEYSNKNWLASGLDKSNEHLKSYYQNKATKTTMITRFNKNFKLSQLKERYGDIVLVFNNLYYNAQTKKFIIHDLNNMHIYRPSFISATHMNAWLSEHRIFGTGVQQAEWFLLNLLEMFPEFETCEDEFGQAIYRILKQMQEATEKSDADDADSFPMSYLDITDELDVIYHKTIDHVVQIGKDCLEIKEHKNVDKAICLVKNTTFNSEGFASGIEQIKNILKTEENLTDALYYNMKQTSKLSTLKESAQGSQYNKLMKYLQQLVRRKVISPEIYVVEQSDAGPHIQFTLLPVSMDYVDRNSIRKTYKDLSESSYKYCESILNDENKYRMFTAPVELTIFLTNNTIRHAINYGNLKFNGTDFYFKNHHATYGTTHGQFGKAGCLGGFMPVLSEASRSMNLFKYINTVIQYLQTFDPADIAGFSTLSHVIFVDNDDKIVYSHSTKLFDGCNIYEIFDGIDLANETILKNIIQRNSGDNAPESETELEAMANAVFTNI